MKGKQLLFQTYLVLEYMDYDIQRLIKNKINFKSSEMKNII